MDSVLFGLAIALIPFAVVGALALRYGAETRPFWDERPHDGRPNL